MVSLAVSRTAGAMPPPPTSLPKRPTLGLRRNSSLMDTDEEAGLSSSTKKLKVAFDPNVDVRILDDWTDKSLELVREEVKLSVHRHNAPADQRDDTQYEKLVALLNQNPFGGDAPSAKLLKKYLIALDAKVSTLGGCGKLVSAVMGLSWLGRDESFAGLYLKFLCSLAAAHSKYIPAIAENLVSNFTKLPASLGRLPEETPVPRDRMFARVHTAIQTLLRQVPSAAAAFISVFKNEFPDDLGTTKSYVQYQTHLLEIAQDIWELRSEILALVMRRLVSIDVQIQQDIEDLEEETEEKLLQRPNSKPEKPSAEDSDDSDIDSISESEETMTEEEQRVRELRLKVDKMDATLDLLFTYYKPLVESDLNPSTNEAYQQLLSHFATFVLPNRTRHAQFLLFHFSQTSPAHASLFARQCLHTAFDSNSSSLRSTACAYLASFVARGSHILLDSVRDIFSILCQSLNDLRKRYEPTCRGPDKRAFSLYYAVAQAILYIFCFRWRDLAIGAADPEPGDEGLTEDDILAEGRELGWLPGIKDTLQKNIYARLNPLKVCSPVIVGEFAKIANHLRFVYVFSILETNKRVRLGHTAAYYGLGGLPDLARRETAWDRKAGEAHLQLEAYFPFDPYHLPKSKHWVAGDYNEWKLPAGMRSHDDEEDYDGFTESGDEDDESDDDGDGDDDGDASGIPDAFVGSTSS